MAVVAFLFGSVIGLFAAIAGAVFTDITFLQAFGIYMGTSIGLGLIALLPAVIRPGGPDGMMPQHFQAA